MINRLGGDALPYLQIGLPPDTATLPCFPLRSCFPAFTSAMPRVSGLFIYPVKSLRGIAVAEASLDDYGLGGDRRFLVVDENNQFLTQRTLPRMALITTELGRESLGAELEDFERFGDVA